MKEKNIKKGMTVVIKSTSQRGVVVCYDESIDAVLIENSEGTRSWFAPNRLKKVK